MNSNNTFSSNRLMLLLRYDLIENGKSYLLQFSGMFVAMVAMVVFGIVVIRDNMMSQDVIDGAFMLVQFNTFLCHTVKTGLDIIFGLSGFYFASTFMARMHSKPAAISYLTIPASTLEKFVARLLVVTVGFLLAFAVAMLLLTGVYALLVAFMLPEGFPSWLLSGEKFALFSNFTDVTGTNPLTQATTYHVWVGELANYVLIALATACYIVGSILWVKNAFLKTSIVMVALWIVDYIWPVKEFFKTDALAFAGIGLMLLLILLGWGVAYVLFSRMQINNK